MPAAGTVKTRRPGHGRSDYCDVRCEPAVRIVRTVSVGVRRSCFVERPLRHDEWFGAALSAGALDSRHAHAPDTASPGVGDSRDVRWQRPAGHQLAQIVRRCRFGVLRGGRFGSRPRRQRHQPEDARTHVVVLFPEFRKLVGDHERPGSVLAIFSGARSAVFLSLRRALLLGGVAAFQFSGFPLTFGGGQPFSFRGFPLTFGSSQPFSFRRGCALTFCCRFFLDAAPLGALALDEGFRLQSPALGFKPSPFFLARPFGRGCSFGFEPTSFLLPFPLGRRFRLFAQPLGLAFAGGCGFCFETASLRVLCPFGGELGFELAPLVLAGALGRCLRFRFCFLPFLFARPLRRRLGLRFESLALFLAGLFRSRLGSSGFRFQTFPFLFARLLRGSLRRRLGFLALFLACARSGGSGLRLGLLSFLFTRPLRGGLGFRFEAFPLLFARLLRDNLRRGLGFLALFLACARGDRSSFCLRSLPFFVAGASRGRGRLGLRVCARAVGFSLLLIGLDLELLRALTLGSRRRLEPSVLFLHLPPFGLTLFLGRTALFLRGLNRQRHARDERRTARDSPRGGSSLRVRIDGASLRRHSNGDAHADSSGCGGAGASAAAGAGTSHSDFLNASARLLRSCDAGTGSSP